LQPAPIAAGMIAQISSKIVRRRKRWGCRHVITLSPIYSMTELAALRSYETSAKIMENQEVGNEEIIFGDGRGGKGSFETCPYKSFLHDQSLKSRVLNDETQSGC
jgi:hypothetical protein